MNHICLHNKFNFPTGNTIVIKNLVNLRFEGKKQARALGTVATRHVSGDTTLGVLHLNSLFKNNTGRL